MIATHNPMMSGMPGAIISTDTLAQDRRTAEELHALTHAFGAEAAAILVALRRELGTSTNRIGLDRAIELASLGDPAFRKACEAHLVTLRKEAAAERAAAAHAQLLADHATQRDALGNGVSGTLATLRRMRVEREMWVDMERAGQTNGNVPPYDERDAEIAVFEKRLTRARDALGAWEAAPENEKSEIYDQVINNSTDTKED